MIENRVVGLQFHLETTPNSAKALIENCRHELDGSKFVQHEKEILAEESRFLRINDVSFRSSVCQRFECGWI